MTTAQSAATPAARGTEAEFPAGVWADLPAAYRDTVDAYTKSKKCLKCANI